MRRKTEIDETKVAKLPHWAQSLVKDLRNEIDGLERQVAQVNGQHADSNVSINSFDGQTKLPKGSTVRFDFGQEYIEVKSATGVRGKKKTVEVRAGMNALVVELYSSNVCFIRPNED